MDKEDDTEVPITSSPIKKPGALVQFITDGGWMMLWVIFLILIVVVINLWK